MTDENEHLRKKSINFSQIRLPKNTLFTERSEFQGDVEWNSGWEMDQSEYQSPRLRRMLDRKEETIIQTYTFPDIFSAWVHGFNKEIESVKPLTPEQITQDLSEAGHDDFLMVKQFIDYALELFGWHWVKRLKLEQNAFFVLCIEYYLCLTISRESHMLEEIEDYFRNAEEHWDVDMEGELQEKIDYFLEEQHTTEEIVSDLCDLLSWKNRY